MAGSSMTFTYDDGVDGAGKHGGIKKVLIDWTSDDSTGAVSGTTRKIVGTLVKGVTDPGSTAPTDNYDINITDEEGLDVLLPCRTAGNLGDLMNRDTSNTEQVHFLVLTNDASPLGTSVHPVVCDKLTVAVTNAGNSKTGQLILYYKQ
jgi:hypothetical protein